MVSGAAMKKTKKAFEVLQRKNAKIVEKGAVDQEAVAKAAAEEALKLEESKKIVLVQDESLATSQKVYEIYH